MQKWTQNVRLVSQHHIGTHHTPYIGRKHVVSKNFGTSVNHIQSLLITTIKIIFRDRWNTICRSRCGTCFYFSQLKIIVVCIGAGNIPAPVIPFLGADNAVTVSSKWSVEKVGHDMIRPYKFIFRIKKWKNENRKIKKVCRGGRGMYVWMCYSTF